MIIGVIVAINILSDMFMLRLDLTQERKYTLSRATKKILKNLPEPVTVTAYFSKDLPPDVAMVRREFKELLIEYGKVSGGKILYEFQNPNENEEIEMAAQQQGIGPVLINLRDKDQMKQQKAYLGAVIQLGERKEIIPFMKPGMPFEYELSTAIKKLAVENKPLIGILQGHGECPLGRLAQVQNALAVLYNTEPVTINDTIDNLSRFNTLAIIAPTDSFSPVHLAQLDNFLNQGKKIFIALNRVRVDLQNGYTNLQNTGLEQWLAQKGLIVEDNLLFDKNCGSVNIQQKYGNMTFTTPVAFPHLPIISNFANHPVTKGLEAVILQFASSIRFSGDSALKFTPIVKSSDASGTEPMPVYFNVQKQWTDRDFPSKNIPVGAALEGKLGSSHTINTKMIVIADGDFPQNEEGQNAQPIHADNINLMVNSIDWLSDETGLIDLRTKAITSRPIKDLETSSKTMIKYLNFLLPIIVVILYGMMRMQRNRTLRVKRMEEGYV